MKKYIITIFTLLIVSIVNAQGHYDGQMSLSANVGVQNNNAFVVNINAQKLFKNNFFGIRADFMYTTTKQDFVIIIPQKLKFETYNVGVAGIYSLEKLINYPFYINLFLGGSYSYDHLNSGKNYGDYDIEYKQLNSNSFGIYGGAEFEYMFYKNLSLSVTSLNDFKIKTDFDNTRIIGLIGIKYNF